MMDTDARAHIDTALARRSPWPFPSPLESLYEADRGPARRMRLAVTLSVVAACIMAAIAFDRPRTPAVLLQRLPWHAGAAMVMFALALLTRWARTARQEAALVTVVALTGMSAVEVLGEREPTALASAYMISAVVVVAGIMAHGQVRLATALVASSACALAFPLVMLAVPGALPLSRFPEVFAAAVIGFSLVCLATRRNEIVRRGEFLHRLRSKIGEAELMRLSTTDVLTGLANRRNFVDEARRVWDDRDQPPFALALVDVDDFKALNDAAGHAAGDLCLAAVARALKGALRHDKDRAARYGGEEFVIMYVGPPNQALPELGERVRAAVEALRLPHPGAPGRVVTVSVGITGQTGRAGSLEGLLGEADRLMYLAKETGRNRVCAATRVREPDFGQPSEAHR